MKKTAVVLFLAMTMALAGCGEKDDANTSNSNSSNAEDNAELEGNGADTQSEDAAQGSDVLSDGIFLHLSLSEMMVSRLVLI